MTGSADRGGRCEVSGPFPAGHRPGCTCGRCYDALAGAYWLGMLGFALAGPVAVIAERMRASHAFWMSDL